jgi:hypothetical protein
MSSENTRQRIAAEAARLIVLRHEPEIHRARIRAAQRVAPGQQHADDLPTAREVREQAQELAQRREHRRRVDKLHEMRLESLRLMRLLREFQPRLTGSVLTGQDDGRHEIELQLFADHVDEVGRVLAGQQIEHDVDRRPKHGAPRALATLVAWVQRFNVRLQVYDTRLASASWKNPVTSRDVPRATAEELEQLLVGSEPREPRQADVAEAETAADRFLAYRILLEPLEQVREHPGRHPEGDALYHSLQVYHLAREELPYDEEFLLAALLHDVGKAIDPKDHVAAGLEALDGLITPRTAWLIEHHAEAQQLHQGTLGVRSRRRLEASEDFEELVLLAQCDRRGRQRGVRVSDLHDALDEIRQLDEMYGD